MLSHIVKTVSGCLHDIQNVVWILTLFYLGLGFVVQLLTSDGIDGVVYFHKPLVRLRDHLPIFYPNDVVQMYWRPRS